MERLAAQTLIARETRVRHGAVPRALAGDAPLRERDWRLAGDAFLLRADGEHWFHYRKGEGITIERGASADPAAEALWLAGTVHAAVAALNGLVPIHASAVAHAGAVHAFAGPSGAGKSTLVAALGARGLPLFCDDTLVLDPSDPARIVCLPGHKRLKLTREALALTGARAGERVAAAVDKHYALPPGGDLAEPLPLARLVFLEAGEDTRIAPVIGAARIARLLDGHYTTVLRAAALGDDPAARFAHFADLAARIAMARFVRPWDARRFADGVEAAARYVRSGH